MEKYDYLQAVIDDVKQYIVDNEIMVTNLCHNMDLLADALSELVCTLDYLEKGAEACDVTIRCYLLGQAISTVLDEIAVDIADDE